MSGASAKLIGRRPRDYLECLPKSRKVRVIGRIRRAYLRHFPPLAVDCAQEACARLIASVSELKNAPIQTGAPNGDWYDQVEEALVRYAAGSVMRRAVVKELCAGRGLQTLDALAAQADDDADDDLVPTGGPTAPYSAASELKWAEDRWHWTRAAALLREQLAQQSNIDPLVLQVFDQLCRNADAFERAHLIDGDDIPDIVRGESFQINHGPLLKSLQETYPASRWDINKLRLKIADLGRDAIRVEESLAGDGILLFEANRHSVAGAGAQARGRREEELHDQGEVDPQRGSLP